MAEYGSQRDFRVTDDVAEGYRIRVLLGVRVLEVRVTDMENEAEDSERMVERR